VPFAWYGHEANTPVGKKRVQKPKTEGIVHSPHLSDCDLIIKH